MNAEELRKHLENNTPSVKVKPVDLPEFGDVSVYVRCMDGSDRSRYENYLAENGKHKNSYYLGLLSQTLCDEAGELLYPDNNGAEIASWPWPVLDRLAEESADLSFVSKKKSTKKNEDS